MERTAFKAMMFAHRAHRNQRRKYTNAPYTDHLAEVAGIVATVAPHDVIDVMVSVAWLHDCVEDQGVEVRALRLDFGEMVAEGVSELSDLETGNRAERKRLSRLRLLASPGWVQTIKCADIISNTSSITQHDPKFAELYIEECRLTLTCMTKADPLLLDLAFSVLSNHAKDNPLLKPAFL